MYLFIHVWSIYISLYVLMYVYTYNKLDRHIHRALLTHPTNSSHPIQATRSWHGVATISRLLKSIDLFCRISSLLQGSFAKETYNLKEPTNRSHPISTLPWPWHLPSQCQLCEFPYVYMFIQHTWYICIHIHIYHFCKFPYVYIYSYVHDVYISLFMYLCIYIHTILDRCINLANVSFVSFHMCIYLFNIHDIYIYIYHFVSFHRYIFIHTCMIYIYLSLCVYLYIYTLQTWS